MCPFTADKIHVEFHYGSGVVQQWSKDGPKACRYEYLMSINENIDFMIGKYIYCLMKGFKLILNFIVTFYKQKISAKLS
jgi:hypothetical protein